MKTFKLTALALLLCALTGYAQSKRYHINVQWPGGDGQKVYLQTNTQSGWNGRIDSATVVSGRCVLEGEFTRYEEFYIGSSAVMKEFLLDPSPVQVRITPPRPGQQYVQISITGGPEQTVYQQFRQLTSDSFQENVRLTALYKKTGGNPAVADSVQKAYAAGNDRYRDDVERLIRRNPDLYAAGAILAKSTFKRSIDQLEELYGLLNKKVRKSYCGKQVRELIDQKIRLTPGAPAMKFSVPGPDGKAVRMADYKGKYVLLDFWSSSCIPCLRSVPLLKEAYSTYKDKGFVIIGLSLDTRRDAWLGAVEKHGMNWVQASSLVGFDCPVRTFYGVVQMPMLVLVDPDGNIVDLTLTAEKLMETLAGMIK